jgi:hypothetical protein
LSFRRRSAAASRRASGELAEAFASVDPALLVELEPRARLPLERVARAAPADEAAVERFGRARPDVVFAPDPDFGSPRLACGTFPPLEQDRD